MNTVTTTLTTTAHFSEDGAKRYLLEKTWDSTKPKLTIIMLAPSAASGITLDSTTTLVLNNASRLGYGSVAIVNLFATLNDFALKHAEDADAENLNAILASVKAADRIVYAPGVGKANSKIFQRRQEQVLNALRPYEARLSCLCDSNGLSRLQHPLSPAVKTWYLSDLKVSELVEDTKRTITVPCKKKSKPKAAPTITT